MKKKFMAMLAKKEARQAELGTKAGAATDIVELRSINTELETLNGEIMELRGLIAEIPDDPAAPGTPAAPEVPESRGATSVPQGALNILGTYSVGATASDTGEKRGIDAVFSMMEAIEYGWGDPLHFSHRNALSLPEKPQLAVDAMRSVIPLHIRP